MHRLVEEGVGPKGRSEALPVLETVLLHAPTTISHQSNRAVDHALLGQILESLGAGDTALPGWYGSIQRRR